MAPLPCSPSAVPAAAAARPRQPRDPEDPAAPRAGPRPAAQTAPVSGPAAQWQVQQQVRGQFGGGHSIQPRNPAIPCFPPLPCPLPPQPHLRPRVLAEPRRRKRRRHLARLVQRAQRVARHLAPLAEGFLDLGGQAAAVGRAGRWVASRTLLPATCRRRLCGKAQQLPRGLMGPERGASAASIGRPTGKPYPHRPARPSHQADKLGDAGHRKPLGGRRELEAHHAAVHLGGGVVLAAVDAEAAGPVEQRLQGEGVGFGGREVGRRRQGAAQPAGRPKLGSGKPCAAAPRHATHAALNRQQPKASCGGRGSQVAGAAEEEGEDVHGPPVGCAWVALREPHPHLVLRHRGGGGAGRGWGEMGEQARRLRGMDCRAASGRGTGRQLAPGSGAGAAVHSLRLSQA